jgi:ferric-dicitrate binding protein FerR (iron transport regulator)
MSKRKKSDDWMESDNPEDWPEAFRLIRESAGADDSASLDKSWAEILRKAEENPDVDAETEALYQTHMRYVARQQFRRVLPYVGAAAALFAIVIGAVVLLRPAPRPATIASASGSGTLSRGGAVQRLTVGLALESDDVLRLDRGARVRLAAGVGLEMSIAGPALVTLDRAAAGDSPAHDWQIQSGVIYVRGEAGKPRRVVWRTAGGSYELLGTVARLAVSETGERLDVVEGTIRISPLDESQPVEVQAGQTAFLERSAETPGVNVRPLSAPAADRVEQEASGETGRVFTGETFPTDAAIKERYGNLFRFVFLDGSELVAAVVSISGGVYRIHARQGLTAVPASQLKSFEEIP